MSKVHPIKTEFGFLNGRDCIYLDSLSFSNRTNALHLKGEINGSLCSEAPSEKWIVYELTFEGVLASKITELDTWESQKDWYSESCFDLVERSKWKNMLGGKVTDNHQQYIVSTYDDIIEVVCKSYSLKFGERRA